MPADIIANAGALLQRYKVVFCDVWGVLHDGKRAYAGANECLPRFRAAGGHVVLVSNAPLPRQAVARLLDQKGVRREVWDAIVSSGDLTQLRMAELAAKHIHHIGPKRDLPLFDGIAAERVSLNEAQALIVTGLVHDATETADDYRAILQAALRRSLPLICANPDLSVEVGGRIYPCAGAIAALYEEMGGVVFWEGKPHAHAYRQAFRVASTLRGKEVSADQVLAIGDGVRTDLAGAAQAGIDALFVAGGLHRDDVMEDGAIDRAKLTRAFTDKAPTTIAAIPYLAW